MTFKDKGPGGLPTAPAPKPDSPPTSYRSGAMQSNARAKRPPSKTPFAWKALPIEALPEPAQKFVMAGAAAIGCDPSMIALPALAACAGAIGTTRQVRLKQSWAEPCILWTGVVARSGTLKSPAFDYPMTALRDAQHRRLREHESAMEVFEAEMHRYEVDLAQWKRGKAKERGHPPKKPQPPLCIRYIVSDTTIEALTPVLLANPRGVLLARDELAAWLTGFNQYKPKGGSDAAAWLELHRAGTVIVDRKTGTQRTIFVPRAAVSVCGTIQPGTIQRLLTREFFEAGLPARLLLAAPPEKQKTWNDADISPDIVNPFRELIGYLLALEHGQNEDGEFVPIDVGLSPEAQALWIEWYNDNAANLARLDDDDLRAVRAKIEGYAARLALVVHLIRAVSNPTYPVNSIGADSMNDGIILARWFAREAERIYGLWRESHEDREERRIIDLAGRHGGRITPRQLCQFDRNFRGPTEVAEHALQLLVEAEKGRWVDDDHGGGPGRPVRYFELSESSTVYGNPETTGENTNSVDVDNSGGLENKPDI